MRKGKNEAERKDGRNETTKNGRRKGKRKMKKGEEKRKRGGRKP